MSDGWIKLHRKIQDCFLWQDKPFDKARAWIDLLLMAMHHDKKIFIDGEPIVVSRGSFMTSTLKLSDRWGWSRNKVLRFLNVLESEQMLNTKRTQNGTLVTIVKYEVFQCGDTTDGTTDETTNETTDETTDETQNKNDKELKNNNICSNSDDLNDTEKPKKKKTKLSDEENQELVKNFEIIYKSYPKKKGKTEAFSRYKLWVTTGKDVNGKKVKVTNRQIWNAIAKYKREMEQKETDLQFYKNFDTFLGKQLLDYIGDDEQ